jgi:hypothetical protein
MSASQAPFPMSFRYKNLCLRNINHKTIPTTAYLTTTQSLDTMTILNNTPIHWESPDALWKSDQRHLACKQQQMHPLSYLGRVGTKVVEERRREVHSLQSVDGVVEVVFIVELDSLLRVAVENGGHDER